MQSQQQWTAAISATAITAQCAVTTMGTANLQQGNNKIFWNNNQPVAIMIYLQEQHNAKVPLTTASQYSSGSIVAAVGCYGMRRIRINSTKQQSTSGNSKSNQHYNSNAGLIATMLHCTCSLIRNSYHHAVTATATENGKSNNRKVTSGTTTTSQPAGIWVAALLGELKGGSGSICNSCLSAVWVLTAIATRKWWLERKNFDSCKENKIIIYQCLVAAFICLFPLVCFIIFLYP